MRRPTTPGEMLKEEFLVPLKMSQRALAEKMGFEVKAVNRVINGKARVTPEFARALSKVLGTSAEIWLGLQNGIDLFDLENK